jgi:hypothetical protein
MQCLHWNLPFCSFEFALVNDWRIGCFVIRLVDLSTERIKQSNLSQSHRQFSHSFLAELLSSEWGSPPPLIGLPS